MVDHDPIPINPKGLGINRVIEANQTQDQIAIPSVLRDKRGRLRWRLPGNSDEANLQIGISNIQALFLDRFPEFDKLFPRNAEGVVDQKMRREAKEFILRNIGTTQKAFITTFGGTSTVQTSVAYFEGSHLVAMAKSFIPWGIPIGEEDEQQVLELFNTQEGIKESIIPLSQSEGSRRIKDYLEGMQVFNEAKPFLLTKAFSLSKNRGTVSLGCIDKKQITISLGSQPALAIQNGRGVLVVPHQSKEEFYQWLTFHEVKPDYTVDLSSVLGSYRLDKENKKITTKGWYGPERQLFQDFITGEKTIDTQSLEEFIVQVDPFRNITFCYFPKEKPIGFKVRNQYSLPQSEVIVKPRFDARRGYSWIEVYTKVEDKELLLTSKKITAGKTTFPEWRGGDIEAMLDWIYGNQSIAIVDPLIVDLKASSTRILLEQTNESSVIFSLNRDPTFKGTSQAILVPGQDDLYRWIRVQRDNGTTEGSYRVFPEERNKLQGGWMGPEKQRYCDYLEGKIDFSHLRKMTIPVKAYAIASLFTFRGKHLSLQLNDLTNFPKGQMINLIPSLNTKGDLILEVSKAETSMIVRRFIYDQQINSFRVIDEQDKVTGKPARYWTSENIELEVKAFYEKEGSLNFLKKKRNDLYVAVKKYPGRLEALTQKLGVELSPQVDQQSSVYIDNEGKRWTHAYFLAKQLGYSPAAVNRILNDSALASILGRSKSGVEVTLYDESEAEKILLSSGYQERSIRYLEIRKQKEEASSLGTLLKEYEEALLSGQIMSYEEFMNIKEKHHE